MKHVCVLRNNKGVVLVIVMLTLVLLSLMGKTITTLATHEMKIAGNDRFEKRTFFAAEAGLGHIRATLQAEFTKRNQAKIASGQRPDWDFALKGILPDIDAATSANFDGGSTWIDDQPLDDGAGLPCSYTVTIWNNPDDGGGITDDTDQLLCVQSVATGPGKAKSRVAITLLGQGTGDAIAGYFAQNGGGSGNNSMDVNKISDFSVQ